MSKSDRVQKTTSMPSGKIDSYSSAPVPNSAFCSFATVTEKEATSSG